jgi:hypothetical protein
MEARQEAEQRLGSVRALALFPALPVVVYLLVR